jgi:lipoprotein-anchoring transpeptidase ErfK/SrfK
MSRFTRTKGSILAILFGGFALCVLVWGAFMFLRPTVQKETPSVQTNQAKPLGATSLAAEPALFPYIEITDGCDWSYTGTCINMRSGPGTEYGVVLRLRTGMVLKVASTATSTDGSIWYKIAFDNSIRYPERVTSDWYVKADAVNLIENNGDHQYIKNVTATTTKRIVVDISQEMLYAYEGDTLFMKEPISTGLEFTPTPHGTFTVYKMTPSRYMQGPLPGVSSQKYDLPGVPWNLYFTKDGAVIHGAYWHNSFGKPWSHGCVNLSPENAKKLYLWADLGIRVTVQN